MNEPVRWIDPDSEASRELRSLVRYAGARGPNEAQLTVLTEAVLAQLPGAGSELEPGRNAAPTNAPVAAPHAALGAPSPQVALGVTLGALVVAGSLLAAWVLSRPRTDVPAPPQRAHQVEPAPDTHEAQPVVDAPLDASTWIAPIVEVPSAPRQRSAQRLRATKEARAASADAGASDQASELGLLHAARIARRSSPRTALQLLNEHQRAYPGTVLHEEREALLIEVLQQLDPAEAAKRLADFEARYPASGYRKGLQKRE